jgi:class 3 adenylate cyclase/tetratricopeptide (TPR) repeat protein
MTVSSTRAFVFTDMVDSTALASRIGDVRTDAVRHAHRRALAEVVVDCGGEVVKDTGDGIMATFGSAVAAMDAAVGAQQAVTRLNRATAFESGGPIAIRVGVSIGEAVEEDGDWFGTPVVEAARLCAAAADGQVLVSDAVRLMAGSRARHPLQGIGPLALKGLAEPLTALEVVWESSGLSWPLPAALERATAARFVGRNAARQALETAAKEAAAGAVRLALLSGEPGIGKTCLAAEVARAAHQAGAVVLYGKADPDRATRLHVWADALGRAADHMTDRQLRGCEALGRLSARLAARVGQVPPRPDDDDDERRFLFESIGALMGRLAEDAPVLLVLDDLQWADETTLNLVRHLVAGADTERLMVVGTVRAGEVADDHPLMQTAAAARRQRRLIRVVLDGLSHDEMAELVGNWQGTAAATELVARIVDRTSGNPLFAEEVLAHIDETGSESGVPPGARLVIGARLALVADAARDLLGVAAVAGRRFEPAVVRAVTGLSSDSFVDAFDAAVGGGFLVEAALGAEFRHDLIREVLLEHLTIPRRAALHWRLGQALQHAHANAPAYAADIARHLLAGFEGGYSDDAATVARATVAAATEAFARTELDEAHAWSDRAYALVDRMGDDLRARADVLAGVVNTSRDRRSLDERRRLMDEAVVLAAQIDDPTLSAWVTSLQMEHAVGVASPGEVTSEIARIDACLARLPETEKELRLSLLVQRFQRGWTMELGGNHQATMAEIENLGLALTSRTGANGGAAPSVHQRVVVARGLHLMGSPDHEAMSALADSAISWRAGGTQWGAIGALQRGDITAFRAARDEMRDQADRYGARYHRYLFTVWTTTLALVEGEYHIALELAEQNMAQNEDNPGQRTSAMAQADSANRELGRIEVSLPNILVWCEHHGGRSTTAIAATMLAWIGRNDEASAMLDRVAVDSYALLRRWFLRSKAVQYTCEAIALLDDTAKAETVLPLAMPYRDQMIAVGDANDVHGAADRGIAQLYSTLGRYDDAEHHYRVALELEQRMESPPLQARTHYWYARMLQRRGGLNDRDESLRHLDITLATTARLSMRQLERDAEALVTLTR